MRVLVKQGSTVGIEDKQRPSHTELYKNKGEPRVIEGAVEL